MKGSERADNWCGRDRRRWGPETVRRSKPQPEGVCPRLLIRGKGNKGSVCTWLGLPVWRQTFEGTFLPWKVSHRPRVRMEMVGLVSEGASGRFGKTVVKNGRGNWVGLSGRIALQQGRSSIWVRSVLIICVSYIG